MPKRPNDALNSFRHFKVEEDSAARLVADFGVESLGAVGHQVVELVVEHQAAVELQQAEGHLVRAGDPGQLTMLLVKIRIT